MKFNEKFLKNLNKIKTSFYRYLNKINFFTIKIENIKKLNKKNKHCLKKFMKSFHVTNMI